MTPGHTVTIHPTDAHVEVHVAGEKVAESDRPLRLEETGLPDRWYLPAEDVDLERFRKTTFHTTCPFKGEASYWSIGEHDGIAWTYEAPIEAAKAIQGHLAFYPDRATVTVDGEPI
jgi:uncharacterized protein (DUF427 family)